MAATYRSSRIRTRSPGFSPCTAWKWPLSSTTAPPALRPWTLRPFFGGRALGRHVAKGPAVSTPPKSPQGHDRSARRGARAIGGGVAVVLERGRPERLGPARQEAGGRGLACSAQCRRAAWTPSTPKDFGARQHPNGPSALRPRFAAQIRSVKRPCVGALASWRT